MLLTDCWDGKFIRTRNSAAFRLCTTTTCLTVRTLMTWKASRAFCVDCRTCPNARALLCRSTRFTIPSIVNSNTCPPKHLTIPVGSCLAGKIILPNILNVNFEMSFVISGKIHFIQTSGNLVSLTEVHSTRSWLLRPKLSFAVGQD